MPEGKFTIFCSYFFWKCVVILWKQCQDINCKLNLGWGLEFLRWLYIMLEYWGQKAVPAFLPIHDTRLNFLIKFQIVPADFTFEKSSFTLACEREI